MNTKDSMWRVISQLISHSASDSPLDNKNIKIIYAPRKRISNQNVRKGSSEASCSYLASLYTDEFNKLDKLASVTFIEAESMNSDVIHNRYLLTDIVGIELPYGFESKRNSKITDDLKILESSIYEKRFRQYDQLTDFRINDKAQLISK